MRRWYLGDLGGRVLDSLGLELFDQAMELLRCSDPFGWQDGLAVLRWGRPAPGECAPP
jgi:hypothetical protein